VAGCSATESTHPLRGAATKVGWATQAGAPKDFVLARRGTAELAYVPVGREPVARPVVLAIAGSAGTHVCPSGPCGAPDARSA
jgi:hypothetical protein